MSETELAWAAGFFDGEGCSHVARSTKPNVSPYVRLAVAQKERGPLFRFQDAVGTGTINGPYGGGVSYWSAGGRLQARAVMEKLWPYLSEPKRDQYLAKKREADASPVSRSTWGGHLGNAKLDAEKVSTIRTRYKSGDVTYQQLADEFGVARCTIGQIIRRESWHLDRHNRVGGEHDQDLQSNRQPADA